MKKKNTMRLRSAPSVPQHVVAGRYEGQTEARVRHLPAREVLDLHADLQRSMARPEADLTRCMTEYATVDLELNPAWAASHLNPSVGLRDLGPWLSSFATDLFGATTYQVTAEMVELAQGLSVTTPDLAEFRAEELPSPYGFAWFDKPVPRPAVDDGGMPPQLMHAVSWAQVPRLSFQVAGTGRTMNVPAVRLRKWGYNDEVNVFPRPLHLMGQNTFSLSPKIRTVLSDIHLVHMIWILMGMEIVTSDAEPVERSARKRAANLKNQEVHVVRLRRSARRDDGAPRRVDWSCTWLVRGHYRKAPHGGTFADGRDRTWVKPYIKGPEGMPLRASDLLYRLSR